MNSTPDRAGPTDAEAGLGLDELDLPRTLEEMNRSELLEVMNDSQFERWLEANGPLNLGQDQ